MKPRVVTAEFVEKLRQAAGGVACGNCGAVGTITIRERYVPRSLGEILGYRVTYGPHGLPLIAWCSACDTGARVAERGGDGPPA